VSGGSEIGHIRGPGDFQSVFNVSRETLERLQVYVDLLVKWQATINLVAPSTLDDVWHRHLADSAQLMALAPSGARTWVDLGSGAGFPGLVMAILLAEDADERRVTLIESDQRKAAFLREVARQTSVPVDIVVERIENAANQSRFSTVDVITARALAPLDRLFAYMNPIFSSKSMALLLKGKAAMEEIEQASRTWKFEVERRASLTEREASILIVSNLQAKSEG
jgi:16S rRNA (guanine527-N7)-methyltransferase